MINHQKLHSQGKKKKPLVIFPEGMTSNGKYILGFKPGAFIGEYSVRPLILKYRNVCEGTIFPNVQVCQCSVSHYFCFFITNCGLPLHTICNMSELPVFEPNEYFWKNYWEPNKDKETRAETYARVVRQIMLDYSGLDDAGHFTQ